MRILVVCQYFYPEQFKVNDICFELVDQGHKVTVLTGLPNYPSGIILKEYRWFRKRHEIIKGVEVIRVPLIGRGNNGKISLVFNYLSYAINASIKALFLNKSFDAIMVYQLSPITMALPALLLKKITGKKIFLYCQDLWPASISAAGISSEGLIHRVLLYFSKWVYHSADKIAISSKLFRNYFREVIGIKDEICYLPVYAENIFNNIPVKNPDNNIVNLVFAGNIGEMQSVETIIQAADILKDQTDIKWHIVGDGSDRTKCEELALGLSNVLFYGKYPIFEMPKFYQIADAFLVTLKADKIISYTLPNKVQSYLAAAKPIIGSIDGETRVVIGEAQCGLCCEAENPQALAQLVNKFVKEKDKHILYGKNARHYYENNFSKEIFFERLNSILETI